MKRKEKERIEVALRIFPLRFERLYYRDWYTNDHQGRPPEVLPRFHSNNLKGKRGGRFWGQARWHGRKIAVVDIGAMLPSGATLEDLRHTVLEEFVHLAFLKHHVQPVLEKAMRSRTLRGVVDRKIMRALAKQMKLGR